MTHELEVMQIKLTKMQGRHAPGLDGLLEEAIEAIQAVIDRLEEET